MWLFLNDAFLSIVAHRDHPERLLVRSRIEGDIERAFSEEERAACGEVFQILEADYRYRMEAPRYVVAALLARQARTMTYTNFKDSIPGDHKKRKLAYMRVWSVMAEYFGAFGGLTRNLERVNPFAEGDDPDIQEFLHGR